ncbi:MAG: NUDIX hydrolase [Patescibacteria group bacterium]
MVRLAGCVIIDAKARLLLLHRNTAAHKHWEIPGGKIEKGESATDAAVRELTEELGVKVKIVKRLGSKDFKDGGKKFDYTWFSAEIIEGTPTILEPELFDDVRYFSGQELRQAKDLSINVQNFLAMLYP